MSICGGCSNFDPEPIDLRSWTPHLYPEIKNDCPGSTFGADWDVQDGGETVIQRVNGQQAMFCSDFNIFDDFDFFTGDVTFTGRVKVEEPPLGEDRDNDYFGFALGFRDGDESPGRRSARADYVLFDWKRRDPNWDAITGGDQRYSNSCREDNPGSGSRCLRYPGYDPRGSNEPVDQCGPVVCQDLLDIGELPDGWNEATIGFSASQVLGLAHADLMWSHQACPAFDNDEGEFSTGFIQELGRGRRFGDQSWEYSSDRNKEWYDFRFDISADVMRVYIDDCETPEMTVRARDLIGRNQFNNGQFCFYNYSQENVRYSAFTAEPNCDDPNPSGKGKGKGKGGGGGKGYYSKSSKGSKSAKGGGGGKGGGAKGAKGGYGKGGGGKGGGGKGGGGKGKGRRGGGRRRNPQTEHRAAATDPAPINSVSEEMP